jgi:site-specific recombinase XerD
VKKRLQQWLKCRGVQTGALFCPVLKNQRIVLRPLRAQAIYTIVQQRSLMAGLGKLRPHDLRRTFVTRLLESKVDINEVRQLVGHADIKTTSRYDYRSSNARQYVNRVFIFK